MTTVKKAAPKGAAPKKTPAKKTVAKKAEAPVAEEEETVNTADLAENVEQEETTEDSVQAETSEESIQDLEDPKPEISQMPVGPSGPVVVIPFLAKKADGAELLYALRSWERHFPDVVIVLVGDTLPELSDRVLHIPHKPTSTNPQIDVASKMAAAIASDLVPEQFVWSNDDIYCVSDIQPAELLLLKAMAGGLSAKGSAGGIYRENAVRTLKALKSEGIESPYDYATHAPVVFEKTRLAETLAKFKCTKEGHLVSSLYFNTHFPNVKPVILDNSGRGSVVASVFRENPNPQVMPTIFKSQKWVNNNPKGWKAVKPYLEKMFPSKSAFEK